VFGLLLTKFRFFLCNKQYIWIEQWLELFICHVFGVHLTKFKFFLRNEQYIWIEQWLEWFICRVFVDNRAISFFFRGERNIRKKFYLELFIWHMIFSHVLSFNPFSKRAEYLNKIVIGIIHLIFDLQPCSQLQSFFPSEQNIWTKPWFKLFICRVFVDHVINFKYFIRCKQNIWIWSLFELLICRAIFDYIMDSKSLFRRAQNTWIIPLFDLSLSRLFIHHAINFKFLLRIEQNIWMES
jgi:hypothetical protein